MRAEFLGKDPESTEGASPAAGDIPALRAIAATVVRRCRRAVSPAAAGGGWESAPTRAFHLSFWRWCC